MTLSYRQRLSLLAVLTLCGGLVVWGKLLELQVIDHAHYVQEAAVQGAPARILPGRRGSIVDARGRPLAADGAAFDLVLVPRDLRGVIHDCPACGARDRVHPDEDGAWPSACASCGAPAELVDRRDFGPLARLLGVSLAELVDRIEEQERNAHEAIQAAMAEFRGRNRELALRNARHDYLRRAWPLYRDVPYEAAREVELNPERNPGLELRAVQRRRYHGGADFVHVVGYTGPLDKRTQGLAGVEAAYDTVLREHDGRIRLRRNRDVAGGQEIVDVVQPQHGETVQLTMDAEDQRLAAAALGGQEGAFVVVDAATGAVLAMASSPTYDPARRQETINEWIDERGGSPLLDRACREHVFPGSVLKPFVAAAVLEAGVSPAATVHCDGYFRIGDRVLTDQLRCHERAGGHGDADLHDAIVGSCNIYFQTWMLEDGFFDRFAALGRRFGFGEPTGIAFEWRSQHGVFPKPGEPWIDPNLKIPVATGQGGVRLSPAQIARAYAGLATGRLPRLHVVARVGDRITEPATTPLRLEIDALDTIRAALRDVPRVGSAQGYALETWGVACKTGTAVTGRGALHNSWMAGFAPARGRRPPIAFAIAVLNTPLGSAGACGPKLRDFLRGFYEGRDDG